MRVLFAALALAAAAAPADASATKLQTLYQRPHGPILAFAQDGPLIAWFAPKPASSNACNAVRVLTPSNGLLFALPSQGGSARNVTCRWLVRGPTVQLALAWRSSNVLWTLRERAPLPFDYVVGAGLTDKKERRFQEIAHARLGEGLWLGGVAGDSSTLVYAVTSVAYVDEVACLAGTGSCRKMVGGGGVYQLVGRQRPKLVRGTSAAVAVATAGGAVAYVPAASVDGSGSPVSRAGKPIRVVDAITGKLLSAVTPHGAPVAIALASNLLATLERTPKGLRIACYARNGAAHSWSVAVPRDTSLELSANNQLVVFRVGRTIHGVDVLTHRMRVLARAAADPIGLSLDGSRLAWAENVNGRGRIRALYLAGRG